MRYLLLPIIPQREVLIIGTNTFLFKTVTILFFDILRKKIKENHLNTSAKYNQQYNSNYIESVCNVHLYCTVF